MRIAIYPSQAGKVWDASTLTTDPLGGSETAVIYIARELARQGHEVYVFARGKPGIYDDVTYIPFERARALLRTLPLDVLICSRDGIPFLWSHRASLKLLWLHDMPQSGQVAPADLYVCVSQWQAGLYVNYGITKPEKTKVIPNGVDLSLFKPYAANDLLEDGPVNLVWTSNPERGLWNMGHVLKKVREVYPQTELHVFGRNAVYGWNDGCEHNFYPDDMTGVVLHEPMSKAGLAEALAQCDLWVYPTWWPETYCIAAVEAQAAGVPVVASKYGALQETATAGLLIPGLPHEKGHLDRMAEETINLLNSVEDRVRMQQNGLAFAATQGWDRQAQLWNDLMNRTLGMVV